MDKINAIYSKVYFYIALFIVCVFFLFFARWVIFL